MKNPETAPFYPATTQEWRAWLQENHEQEASAWIVYYKRKSGKPSISWSQAVDEALCFGWIDSKAKPVDDEKYIQFFSKRKPASIWSKINKEKVRRLTEDGLMTPAGFKSIEIAKANGSWTILDAVEELVIPEDLELAFEREPGSKLFFTGLSRSVKKSILQWLVMAKRPETLQKRIDEIAAAAGQELKPKSFR